MTPDPLIPAPKVRELIGNVSDMTLHRRLADGTFPPPLYINKRRYWRKSVVADWLDRRDDPAVQAEHTIDRTAAAERAAHARSCREPADA